MHLLEARRNGTFTAREIENMQPAFGQTGQLFQDIGRQPGKIGRWLAGIALWEWGKHWCFIRGGHLKARKLIGLCMNSGLKVLLALLNSLPSRFFLFPLHLVYKLKSIIYYNWHSKSSWRSTKHYLKIICISI